MDPAWFTPVTVTDEHHRWYGSLNVRQQARFDEIARYYAGARSPVQRLLLNKLLTDALPFAVTMRSQRNRRGRYHVDDRQLGIREVEWLADGRARCTCDLYLQTGQFSDYNGLCAHVMAVWVAVGPADLAPGTSTSWPPPLGPTPRS